MAVTQGKRRSEDRDVVRAADRRRRLRPALALGVTLLAYLFTGLMWSLSSPVGSSPDDDYHLTSIWCPPPVETSGCRIESRQPLTVMVPEKVARASATYAFKPEQNGNPAQALSDTLLVGSNRVDDGDYPGPYYRVMHLLVGTDVDRAVLTMRVANVLLPLVLLGALAVVGRPADRRLIAYTAAATCVPLGLFLWASVNPSSWAYTGTLVAWTGMLTAYSAPRGARLWISSTVTLTGAVMAAVARADSGPYLGVAAAVSVWLLWPTLARRLVRLLLPATVVAVGLWSFFSSSQSGSAVANAEPPAAWANLVLTNALGLPRLPLGIYGLDPGLRLGWADTPMPALVYVPAIGALFVLVAVGLTSLGLRKTLAWAGTTFLFFALPMYMLVKDMVEIGTYVQPRYFLPLAVLVVGTTVLRAKPDEVVRLSLGQRIFVVTALAGAQSVALLTNLSRYVTGLRGAWIFGSGGADRWWWPVDIASPLTVWVVGSVAFAVALGSSVGAFSGDKPATAQLAKSRL